MSDQPQPKQKQGLAIDIGQTRLVVFDERSLEEAVTCLVSMSIIAGERNDLVRSQQLEQQAHSVNIQFRAMQEGLLMPPSRI